MTYNLDLSVDVLVRIERSVRQQAGPDWNQQAWGIVDLPSGVNFLDMVIDDKTGLPAGVGSCHSAFCFAGWGLTLRNIKMAWEPVPLSDQLIARVTTAGDPIEEVATLLFGILYDDAQDKDLWDDQEDMPALFSADNSLDDLYRIVAAHAEMSEEDLRGMVAYRFDHDTDPLVLAGRTGEW